MSDEFPERIKALMEATLGASLLTLQFWAPYLDGFVRGAHAIAAVCGAVLGVHAVVRIFRGRSVHRQEEDVDDMAR